MSWQDVFFGLIKPWESFRSHPYRDDRGIWTIGYGSIWVNGNGANGQRVTASTPAIDEPTARQWVINYIMPVHAAFLLHAQREGSDNQVGAMMSLAYNIGKPEFLGSTVLRDFNAGNFPAAADAFLLWNKSEGRVDNGLVNRRKAERAVFLKP